MIAFDENACLRINPFDGDFGTPSDTILRDRIVTSRGNAPCFECLTPTEKGDRVRTMVAVFDGVFQSYRWCSACCSAHVSYSNSSYEQINQRADVRRKNEAVSNGQ